MKKLMMVLVVIGLVFGVSSAMAKNDKSKNPNANPGKVWICHFTKGGHAADMDFLLSGINMDKLNPGAVECCESFPNTIIINVAWKGWMNGHQGDEWKYEEICRETE